MKYNIYKFLMFLFILNITSISCLGKQKVYKYDEDEPLIKRIDKATSRARAENIKNGFWVIYTIQMNYSGKRYFEGRWPQYFSEYDFSYIDDKRPGLKDIISGRKIKTYFEEDKEKVKRAAEKVLKDLETLKDRKFLKRWYFWEGEEERAIIFLYSTYNRISPERVRILFLNQEFVDDDKPIFWLGKSSDKESINFLEQLYNNCGNYWIKRKIISAIGLHETPGYVIPVLKNIILNETDFALQEEAISCLGYFPNKETLNFFKDIYNLRSSFDFKNYIMRAISKNYSDEAITFLENIVKSEENETEIRKKAIRALGNIKNKRAFNILIDLIDFSEQVQLKEEAVKCLGGFNEGDSIPALIFIAKSNPDLNIKKIALKRLAGNEDFRVLEFFKNILF